jgi:hypothetical protein
VRVSPTLTDFTVGFRFAVRFRVPVQSVTTGVGRRETAVLRSSPPTPCAPGPFVSDVVTVGSKDKDPEAGVAGSHVGSPEATPFRIVPEVGKVAEYTSDGPKIGSSAISQTSL